MTWNWKLLHKENEEQASDLQLFWRKMDLNSDALKWVRELRKNLFGTKLQKVTRPLCFFNIRRKARKPLILRKSTPFFTKKTLRKIRGPWCVVLICLWRRSVPICFIGSTFSYLVISKKKWQKERCWINTTRRISIRPKFHVGECPKTNKSKSEWCFQWAFVAVHVATTFTKEQNSIHVKKT